MDQGSDGQLDVGAAVRIAQSSGMKVGTSIDPPYPFTQGVQKAEDVALAALPQVERLLTSGDANAVHDVATNVRFCFPPLNPQPNWLTWFLQREQPDESGYASGYRCNCQFAVYDWASSSTALLATLQIVTMVDRRKEDVLTMSHGASANFHVTICGLETAISVSEH